MDIKVLNFHAHEKVIIQMWNVAVADFKVSNDVICCRTFQDFGIGMKFVTVHIFTCDIQTRFLGPAFAMWSALSRTLFPISMNFLSAIQCYTSIIFGPECSCIGLTSGQR